MTRQVYLNLELDHEHMGRFTGHDDEPPLDELLDYLAGEVSPSHAAELLELEAFLWQRQSHVLGRADRS